MTVEIYFTINLHRSMGSGWGRTCDPWTASQTHILGRTAVVKISGSSVRVYAVIISKYATKIVGTQKRQVACVHGTQDQKRSTFNIFKPAQ